MARKLIPNEFCTLHDLKEITGPLPKPHNWRLLEPAQVGAIHALPESQGVAVATNGILVVIIRPLGIFIGHMENFVIDVEATARGTEKKERVVRAAARKQAVNKINMDDFI